MSRSARYSRLRSIRPLWERRGLHCERRHQAVMFAMRVSVTNEVYLSAMARSKYRRSMVLFQSIG